jgi:hypothetical protein
MYIPYRCRVLRRSPGVTDSTASSACVPGFGPSAMALERRPAPSSSVSFDDGRSDRSLPESPVWVFTSSGAFRFLVAALPFDFLSGFSACSRSASWVAFFGVLAVRPVRLLGASASFPSASSLLFRFVAFLTGVINPSQPPFSPNSRMVSYASCVTGCTPKHGPE